MRKSLKFLRNYIAKYLNNGVLTAHLLRLKDNIVEGDIHFLQHLQCQYLQHQEPMMMVHHIIYSISLHRHHWMIHERMPFSEVLLLDGNPHNHHRDQCH